MRVSAAVSAAPAVATDSPILAIRNPGTTDVFLVELWLSNTNAPTGIAPIGIYRAANTPVATTVVLGQPEDPADATPVGSIETAWSTAPTRGANVSLRRAMYQASNQGNLSYLWPDESGFVIPPSGWLVVWNHNTGTTAMQLVCSAVWME